MLETYSYEYNELSDAKRKNIKLKYDPTNLFFKIYNYKDWFKNEESVDTTRKSDQEESVDLSDMSLLQINY